MKSTQATHPITIEQAMDVLGPIRTVWVRGRHNPKQPCWLDGRKVGTAEVIQAAHERLDQLWDRGIWEPKNG